MFCIAKDIRFSAMANAETPWKNRLCSRCLIGNKKIHKLFNNNGEIINENEIL